MPISPDEWPTPFVFFQKSSFFQEAKTLFTRFFLSLSNKPNLVFTLFNRHHSHTKIGTTISRPESSTKKIKLIIFLRLFSGKQQL